MGVRIYVLEQVSLVLNMPNKSLGQHWLKDRLILEAIAHSVDITPATTVLEIGPGLGTLTSVLLAQAQEVVAVEYDADLAAKLPGQFPGKNLEVIHADFLTFDLEALPQGYMVVANIPYYITAKIVQRLVRAGNKPTAMALLIQEEVARKFAGEDGRATPLSIESGLFYDIQLGPRVEKSMFTPAPQVDSQVVIFTKRQQDKNAYIDPSHIMRVVHAGFSSPRKKLKTALSGGLGITKNTAEQLLLNAGISPDARAETLETAEWRRLAELLR